MSVFAFEVSVAGKDWREIVNATSAGRAKSAYHSRVLDAWPDVPFTAMRCRKIGPPHTSPGFARNAEYRGMPGLKCGQRVQVGEAVGTVVGHNDSANFDVLFDVDSPSYAGLTLNVHPNGIAIIT